MRYLNRSKVERSLGRFALNGLFFAFAFQRGLTAVNAQAAQEESAVVACFVVQAVVGLFAAACVATDRFVVGSLAVLGTAVTLTTPVALLVAGGSSTSVALMQVFLAVFATLMLACFLRGKV